MASRPYAAALPSDRVQEVHIRVSGGYVPASVIARAGSPLRVVFDRLDDDPCTDRVVFSSPHIERRLAPFGSTVVDLPEQGPGDIRFTCAMGRYRGQIHLVEQRRLSRRLSGEGAWIALLGALVVLAATAFVAAISIGDELVVAIAVPLVLAWVVAWLQLSNRPLRR